MELTRSNLFYLIVGCFILIGVLSFNFFETKTSLFGLNNESFQSNVLDGADVVDGKYVYPDGSISLLKPPSDDYDSLVVTKIK
jgi:hypothetical protein